MSEVFKLMPVGAKIIVLPDEPEKQKGAILLPDSAQELPSRGILVIAGDCKSAALTRAVPGSKVLYKKYHGTEIVHNDKTYLILGEDDVLATVDP